ncbi:hypothetical protein [Pantoea sp. B65]|uniref:hypothetical protein n=1 Tax=Pantoea sp. B65 TaxID=2813359 RepID=UPI0039B571F6
MNQYYYVDTHHGYRHGHVVHATGCKYLPGTRDRKFLGSFYTTADALLQAKKYYRHVCGCSGCCPQSFSPPSLKKVSNRRKNMDLHSLELI